MKSRSACADVLSVMEQSTPHITPPSSGEPKHDAEHIGVSAEELMELIRSGQGSDVNELVRQTLLDRHAA